MKSMILSLSLLISQAAFASPSWKCSHEGKEVFKSTLNGTKFHDSELDMTVDLTETAKSIDVLEGYSQDGHEQYDYQATFQPDGTVKVKKTYYSDGHELKSEEVVLTCQIRHC